MFGLWYKTEGAALRRTPSTLILPLRVVCLASLPRPRGTPTSVPRVFLILVCWEGPILAIGTPRICPFYDIYANFPTELLSHGNTMEEGLAQSSPACDTDAHTSCTATKQFPVIMRKHTQSLTIICIGSSCALYNSPVLPLIVVLVCDASIQ